MATTNIQQAINMEFPEESIKKFIEQEFLSLKQKISTNIDSTGKKASGKTQQSLRYEALSNTQMLIGRADFEELETGTPPKAQPANFQDIIYQWSIDKGIPIQEEVKLKAFSYRVTKLIKQAGSKDYREGRRINIYSNEVEDSWQRIDDYIGKQIEWFLTTIRL